MSFLEEWRNQIVLETSIDLLGLVNGVLLRPVNQTSTAPRYHRFKKLQPRNVLQVHRDQWHLSKPPKSVEIPPQAK